MNWLKYKYKVLSTGSFEFFTVIFYKLANTHIVLINTDCVFQIKTKKKNAIYYDYTR